MEGTSGAVDLALFRERVRDAALHGAACFGTTGPVGWFREEAVTARPPKMVVFQVVFGTSRRHEVPKSDRLG